MIQSICSCSSETFTVGERNDFKEVNGIQIPVRVKITAEFIPLRLLLKKFFELPNLLSDTFSHVNSLLSVSHIVSNFVQGNYWREFLHHCTKTPVSPIFIYFDEFEVNNPLGSHAGFGKIGAVYPSVPCLPREYQAKHCCNNIYSVR